MSQRMQECLLGQDPNYLYPFLMYREPSELVPEEDIIKEIEAIYRSGCGAFLIETRGHSDWGGARWWKDMGLVLREAKKWGLKVWLTDDVTVPSGKANWALKSGYPELHRKALVQNTVDMMGPQKGASILTEVFQQAGESLYAAIAYKMEGTDENPVYSQPIDLTEKTHNGLLTWDVPEGFWRIFLIFNTQSRGAAGLWDFVDVLNPESCKLMISHVYQPHYDHFKEYFGNTLTGFFTDEPVIGNVAVEKMNYNERLGVDTFVVPWREDLLSCIGEPEGWTEEEVKLALPGLWRDMGGKTAALRRRYMDILTRNYSENFVKPIGVWCREHGVLYTGHVLEDMNAHFRSGWSTGHFFRSQEGQHTAGFDLVLQQVMVGNYTYSHASHNSAKYADPEFFLYYLGRLGASCGHLYPQMEGRVMCENAGTDGWAEGLSTRKYKLDAMMVAGGNLVCSAVFDPKWQNNHIPPFAYDHGEHPQYPHMKPLMQYTNRLCHLLSGGVHKANALLYYNAESDWAGTTPPPQKTAAVLGRNHIDFDIAPWDLLKGDTLTIHNHKLHIHKETFDALVVPPCSTLPAEILNGFEKIAARAPVIFADQLPKVAETGEVFTPVHALCMAKEEIPGWFQENGFVDFRLEGTPELIHFHMGHENTETYLFMNLSAAKAVDTVAEFAYTGNYAVYDPWTNTTIGRSTSDGKIRLRIPAKGTLVLIFGAEGAGDGLLPGELEDLQWTVIPEDTSISMTLRGCTQKEWNAPVSMQAAELRNLAPEMPYFAGTLKYTLTLNTQKPVSYLDLGTVGETAAVTVNGIDCGVLVSAPFRFQVTDAWKEGENTVEITVASNYGYLKRDAFSKFITLPPTGLVGPIAWA